MLQMEHSLLEQYRKQWQWRKWDDVFSKLPDLNKKLIYDLGCAHGDHSKKLSTMGAIIQGLDANENLLSYAQERNIENASFNFCNLENINTNDFAKADGIWTSFVPAYFPNFIETLLNWKKLLKPNGWIAITEMSGLFDHSPMKEEYIQLINKFYNDSYNKNNYDFESGQKLKPNLEKAGFKIVEEYILDDQELSFQGIADPEVLAAWKNRFNRMGGLKEFFGESFEPFKSDFLNSLEQEDHISNCKVFFYIAKL
jgi:SAM-dependent methyltransferase